LLTIPKPLFFGFLDIFNIWVEKSKTPDKQWVFCFYDLTYAWFQGVTYMYNQEDELDQAVVKAFWQSLKHIRFHKNTRKTFDATVALVERDIFEKDSEDGTITYSPPSRTNAIGSYMHGISEYLEEDIDKLEHGSRLDLLLFYIEEAGTGTFLNVPALQGAQPASSSSSSDSEPVEGLIGEHAFMHEQTGSLMLIKGDTMIVVTTDQIKTKLGVSFPSDLQVECTDVSKAFFVQANNNEMLIIGIFNTHEAWTWGQVINRPLKFAPKVKRHGIVKGYLRTQGSSKPKHVDLRFCVLKRPAHTLFTLIRDTTEMANPLNQQALYNMLRAMDRNSMLCHSFNWHRILVYRSCKHHRQLSFKIADFCHTWFIGNNQSVLYGFNLYTREFGMPSRVYGVPPLVNAHFMDTPDSHFTYDNYALTRAPPPLYLHPNLSAFYLSITRLCIPHYTKTKPADMGDVLVHARPLLTEFKKKVDDIRRRFQ
jgi:hypothetical protein